MQLLNVLFGLLFAIVVAAQDAGAPKELVIETTYAPPECSIKSQKGDVVKVHYVRVLFFECILLLLVSTFLDRPASCSQMARSLIRGLRLPFSAGRTSPRTSYSLDRGTPFPVTRECTLLLYARAHGLNFL